MQKSKDKYRAILDPSLHQVTISYFLSHTEERLPLKTLIDSGATVDNYVSTNVAISLAFVP